MPRNTVKRTGSGDKATDGKVMAEFRTATVIQSIERLKKVGNKASYELSKEQVDAIMDALKEELIDLEVALRKGYKPIAKQFSL